MSAISVVVPIYNTEKYLRKCIDSILNQTFRDIEIILVDDGSVDGSGLICDEYKLKDDRVKVFHQFNSGVSVARNRGIVESNGKYICFVDSDDFIDSDYFEKAIEFINKYNPDILINNLYEDKFKQKEDSRLNIMLMDKKDAIRKMFEKKYFEWCPVASFYKSQICKANLFDKSICYGEDLLFKYLFLCKSETILYVSLRKYCYVYRDDSACNSYNLLKKVDDLKVLQFIVDREDNELGEMVYRNEYLPRLIKYHKFGSRSNVEKERELAMHFKNELLQIWKQIILDSSVSFSLKFKMIRFLVLYVI